MKSKFNSNIAYFNCVKYIFFQCVVDDDFQDEGDECAVNPVNCADGISYSMFYKNTFRKTI